jgi:hypothetical protein
LERKNESFYEKLSEGIRKSEAFFYLNVLVAKQNLHPAVLTSVVRLLGILAVVKFKDSSIN